MPAMRVCARARWIITLLLCSTVFVRAYKFEKKHTLNCALQVTLAVKVIIAQTMTKLSAVATRLVCCLWRHAHLTHLHRFSLERAGPIPPESPFSHTRAALRSGHWPRPRGGERLWRARWVAMDTNRGSRNENCSKNKYWPSKHQF